MTSLAGFSIGELAAYVADHLHQKGIDVVLVGGACICIYSENAYSSFDLDFIATGMAGRQSIRQALAEIGFTEEQRYFKHQETEYFVEFPSGPLAIGDEPPGEIASRTYTTGVLRLLSPTDSVTRTVWPPTFTGRTGKASNRRYWLPKAIPWTLPRCGAGR